MGLIKLTSDQIENWVARHFEYKRRKGGDELLICNPFVPGDNKYKFNISTVAKESKRTKHSNYWVHDWRPSAQQYNGSFLKFVQRYKVLLVKGLITNVVPSLVCAITSLSYEHTQVLGNTLKRISAEKA